MEKKNVLHIKECFFELPDDYQGSLGEALMLMANRVIQSEAYKEGKEIKCCNVYEYFAKHRTGKCVIGCEFIKI